MVEGSHSSSVASASCQFIASFPEDIWEVPGATDCRMENPRHAGEKASHPIQAPPLRLLLWVVVSPSWLGCLWEASGLWVFRNGNPLEAG